MFLSKMIYFINVEYMHFAVDKSAEFHGLE